MDNTDNKLKDLRQATEFDIKIRIVSMSQRLHEVLDRLEDLEKIIKGNGKAGLEREVITLSAENKLIKFLIPLLSAVFGALIGQLIPLIVNIV